MEELINRLFDELAKQTARAAFAEKERDQYNAWWHMYKDNCEKLENELNALKEAANDTDGA